MSEGSIRPEFSRPLPVEDIGAGVRRQIAAEPEELRALAQRMKLPDIVSLQADLSVEPQGGGSYLVKGRMQARVAQECVRTLDVFEDDVTAEVERLFVPADSPAARALEEGPVLELDMEAPDAPDVIHDGAIDLGELVAETLALSLDPWPHKPGTDYVDMEAAAPETNEVEKPDNPFAALKRLRDRDR